MKTSITQEQLDRLIQTLELKKTYYSQDVLKYAESLTKVANFEESISSMRMHPQDLYEKEGRINALAKFIKSEEAGGYGYEYLIELLTEFPRDTYSGRGNDAVRSYRDGQLDQARDLMRKFFRND
jgi:hypothetical protein